MFLCCHFLPPGSVLCTCAHPCSHCPAPRVSPPRPLVSLVCVASSLLVGSASRHVSVHPGSLVSSCVSCALDLFPRHFLVCLQFLYFSLVFFFFPFLSSPLLLSLWLLYFGLWFSALFNISCYSPYLPVFVSVCDIWPHSPPSIQSHQLQIWTWCMFGKRQDHNVWSPLAKPSFAGWVWSLFWFTFIRSGIQNMAQCATRASHYFEMVSEHATGLIRIRAVIMFLLSWQ